MESRIVACEQCRRKNRVPATGEGMPKCGNCGAPLPWVVDAGDDNFAEIAEKATPYVLIDFWATWCAPCRMVSPALEQVAKDLAGTIKLVKVDIDQNPHLSQRFQIQAVPTLLIMDKGVVADRKTGAAPAPTLRSWVEEATAGRTIAKGR
ncbi:thioredoxin [Streptomyces sp. NPDC005283]|uniref:thioredoxin n=1 Tax=Streptomyces sp. NPDC005283 TaxID=3156871 RepID=UPI003455A96F